MNHWVWIFAGLTALIAEIFVSGYYLAGFGFSAILTAILFPRQFPLYGWEIVAFLLLGAGLTRAFRRIARRHVLEVETSPEVQKLVGRAGLVLERIIAWRAGVVEIDGRVWEAISEERTPLHRLGRVIVRAVVKNRLIVASGEEQTNHESQESGLSKNEPTPGNSGNKEQR
jgi:membrane protein implicated in regulation of membrane protease activity